MSPSVLYRKWRPQTLAQVIGQEHVTRTLLNALATGKVSHAYLFCGPRGTGKTSTARILAKALNCLEGGKGEPCGECHMCQSIIEGRALDLVEIDAASNRGIDDIRELRDKINFAPAEARYKVYVVDEVHMLTDPAFNALLKTLEEPPPYAVFVLATTEVHQVPVTILSRCQRFDFRRISQQALVDHLAHIAEAEGIEAESEGLDLIVRHSGGSARDAVNLLEQVEVSCGGRVALADVQQILGLTGDPRALEVVLALAHKDLQAGLTLLNHVRESGVNLQQFGREVSDYLRAIMLLKAETPELVEMPSDIIAQLRGAAAAMSLDDVIKAVRGFSQLDFHGDGGSSLPLELALADVILVPAAPAVVAAPASRAAPQPTAAQPRVNRPQPQDIPINVPAAGPAAPRPAVAPAGAAAAAAAAPPSPAGPPPSSAPRPASPPPSAPGQSAPRPVAPAASTTNGASSDLDGLRQMIKEVRVPQMKFIESLLRNGCSVEQVDGKQLVLGFRQGLASHKERLERPENLRMAEQALKEATGVDYRIRCVLVGDAPSAAPANGHLVRAAMDAGARRIAHDS